MRFSRNVALKAVAAAVVVGAALATQGLALATETAEQAGQPVEGDYWIGVRCAELPEMLQAQLDLPDGQGVLVDEVVADSPAHQAGLKAYDVISAVDGKPITGPQALAEAVARAENREIKIEYLRAGRKQTASVKPAPRPDLIGARQRDQRAIRDWAERLGRGPAPMNFRFFHPGMVLPHGASIAPPLPGDMTVTIEKRGDRPAKVTAKQGEKKWEATEESLEELPAEARRFAERLLGVGGFDLGAFERPPMPGSPAAAHPFSPPNRRDAGARLNERLDEMKNQIDDLRKSVEKLQNRE